MKIKLIVYVLAGVAVLFALVVVGRREARHQRDVQVLGIERVVALVGPIDSPTLTGYRTGPNYWCLDYRRGTIVFALELCFNDSRKMLDASDREGATPVVYSLRLAPKAVTPLLREAATNRALTRMRRRAIHDIADTVRATLTRCRGSFALQDIVRRPAQTARKGLSRCVPGTALQPVASDAAQTNNAEFVRDVVSAVRLADAWTGMLQRLAASPSDAARLRIEAGVLDRRWSVLLKRLPA